jgi:hypothetical protein
MKKQTAIEQLYDWYMDQNNWLRPEHKKDYEYQDILQKIREFKELEKEQIIDAYIQKRGKRSLREVLKCLDNAEQYYTSTYEK